jgi:xylan 1,4-beta-xylosidase
VAPAGAAQVIMTFSPSPERQQPLSRQQRPRTSGAGRAALIGLVGLAVAVVTAASAPQPQSPPPSPSQAQSSPPASAPVPSPTGTFPVAMHLDAGKTSGALRPIWRFFGADEPNYAYMQDGRKLLTELGALAPKHVYYRTHNLLTSGDGTPALKWGSTNAYHEDAQGAAVYDWTIVDRIFDTYLQRGIKPYVQIGFMPKDLSTKPEPYQHAWTPTAKYDQIYTGWSYPPKDYQKWGDLAYAWTKHCVDKYGRAEVEQWYWEVWNESNIGYWRGTPEEFRKLYDYAVDGVRRALPTARVGGPETAGHGAQFTRDFFEHALRGTNFATGKTGSPIDFLSFHAKGRPSFVDGHVRLGIAEQLATIDEGFRIIASFPELKDKPIVIGESDPDGCAACQGPQLGYRNTTMFSSYTAAVFARKLDLAERHGVNLEGALTWAFEFENQAYFAGFRVLATNGIDQPVLNVFRMFSRMGAQRVPIVSEGAVPLDTLIKAGVHGPQADVAALASRDARRLTIMAWHYHDDDVAGPSADVTLALDGLPAALGKTKPRVQQFRIDADHSNAYTVWQKMGSPPQPTTAQYAQLERAGQLTAVAEPVALSIEKAPRSNTPRGTPAAGASSADRSSSTTPTLASSDTSRGTMRFTLPRQAVSLFVIEW